MKLRNKKTGEVREGRVEVIFQNNDKFTNPLERHSVESFAEFNDEWEEVEEPLIKDERIRRAVRAWVEIGKYERVYYDRAYNRLADDYDFVHCIEFAIDPCPDAESERCYTLTELCGEEEE